MANILLIDDDPQILGLYATFLKGKGHTVTKAPGGKAGICLLAENQYDLLITDIIMPEKDGFEVLMSLKHLPGSPKIIAISGGSPALSQDYLLNSAKLFSADLVFQKPLGLQQLSDAIDKLLCTDS